MIEGHAEEGQLEPAQLDDVVRFGSYDVELEVGETYVIGSLVNERRNTDFIREVWAMLQAEPKYDLVGNV